MLKLEEEMINTGYLSELVSIVEFKKFFKSFVSKTNLQELNFKGLANQLTDVVKFKATPTDLNTKDLLKPFEIDLKRFQEINKFHFYLEKLKKTIDNEENTPENNIKKIIAENTKYISTTEIVHHTFYKKYAEHSLLSELHSVSKAQLTSLLSNILGFNISEADYSPVENLMRVHLGKDGSDILGYQNNKNSLNIEFSLDDSKIVARLRLCGLPAVKDVDFIKKSLHLNLVETGMENKEHFLSSLAVELIKLDTRIAEVIKDNLHNRTPLLEDLDLSVSEFLSLFELDKTLGKLAKLISEYNYTIYWKALKKVLEDNYTKFTVENKKYVELLLKSLGFEVDYGASLGLNSIRLGLSAQQEVDLYIGKKVTLSEILN